MVGTVGSMVLYQWYCTTVIHSRVPQPGVRAAVVDRSRPATDPSSLPFPFLVKTGDLIVA